MAAPPAQAPEHLTAVAGKLPVKRRTPDRSVPGSVEIEGDDFEDDDDGGDEEEEAPAASQSKFQRIWSESDEIRFLQGLLACHTQAMTFPRDLNLFFDRFSETISQPYTRSQLSEKLRRLRKKFRSQSVRVARGLDVSCLLPRDRDIFRLSSLLWDPACAAASPFGSSASSVPGNKRRRHIPVGGASAAGSIPPSSPKHSSPMLPPPSSSCPINPSNGKRAGDSGACSGPREDRRQNHFIEGRTFLGQMTLKTTLDVFDRCLKEVRSNLIHRGLLHSDPSQISAAPRDLSKRWREQRMAEFELLAGRLRLAIEQAVED